MIDSILPSQKYTLLFERLFDFVLSKSDGDSMCRSFLGPVGVLMSLL